ncbi:MAG: hypothetical protein QMD65_00595 [Patescibacteria group bacterium]|nr:hypothetical protein [Patescibacteria group bacterium]
MSLFRKLIGVVFLLVLIYGVYVLYERWWNKDKSLSQVFENVESVVAEKAKGQVNKYQEAAKKTATNFIKQKIAEGLSMAGEEIMSFSGSLLNQSTTLGMTGDKKFLNVFDIKAFKS